MKHYNRRKRHFQALACGTLAAAVIAGAAICAPKAEGKRTPSVTAYAVTAPSEREPDRYCVIPGRTVNPSVSLPGNSGARAASGLPRPISPYTGEPRTADLCVEIEPIEGCLPEGTGDRNTDSHVAALLGMTEQEALHVDGKAETAIMCSYPSGNARYLGTYKITGYDICVQCCGKVDGITASGTQATVGRTCAADASLPFGTRLWIEGIGERIVEDRGGGVNGQHIDVLVEDHAAAYAITGTYQVWILED